MTQENKPPIGSVAWRDLTVENADGVRRFYEDVVGWTTREHPMGEYSDYDVLTADGSDTVAGICHARGSNVNLPASWLVYVVVKDVGESARRCEELGGRVIDGPRAMGTSDFCVIEDPAGAVLALISQ